MTYIVYTYFGKWLKTFTVPENRTHHETAKAARDYLLQYERESGKRAWIKTQ